MSTAKTVSWFKDNHAYFAKQASLEHYDLARRIVEKELVGIDHLLDIGNGGFFNYDTALVNRVCAVDVFFDDDAVAPARASFVRASALDLPFGASAFDGVLLQNVLHHITGESVAENFANLRRAFREIYRTLRPGGKVVIVESTVGKSFFAFESAVYPFARGFTLGRHEVPFQYTAQQLITEAGAAGFGIARWDWIPRSRFILQFGIKWPSALSPAHPIALILER